MASVAFEKQTITLPITMPMDDRHGWGFLLLLGTVATLFLRPADLVPALEAWPIYQFLIVFCLLVSARATIRQFSTRNLIEQPVLSSLILLLLAVVLSHLSHGFVWAARASLVECFKVIAIYLLILGLVNTPYRMIKFIQWLAISIAAVATLSLLDRYGWVSIAALESIRDRGTLDVDSFLYVDRIRGTGIFQDPNDFGLVLVTGLILNVSFLLRPHAGWLRHFWLLPCLVLIVAIALTHSRGALLSFICAVPAALAYCYSVRIGVASLVLLPTLAVLFSSRMTDINAVVEGTGQSRIQIWSESFAIWKRFPVFGLGEGLLVDELGVVTHNSFLHCFAELGFLGGFAFVSCFFAACVGLWQLRDASVAEVPKKFTKDIEQLAHYRTYVFAALVAYMAGILTLSRQFVVPTYLVLGLATSAFTIGSNETTRFKVSNRTVLLALAASLGLLFAIYITVRILLRR